MSLVNREDDRDIIMQETEQVEQKPRRSIFSYIKIFAVIAVILFVWGGIFSSIYRGSKTIYVDNPTGTWVTITFNQSDAIVIPANTFMKVNLSSWTFNLKVDGKDMWDFEKKFMDWDAFLNPTNAIYVKEEILYSDEEDYDKYFDKLPNNSFDLLWDTLEGPFTKFEGMYIQWSWNYNIDEEFPEEVSMKSKKDYAIKSKLYRLNDFIDMYNSEYAYEDESEQNQEQK